jgi:hypothetical protein
VITPSSHIVPMEFPKWTRLTWQNNLATPARWTKLCVTSAQFCRATIDPLKRDFLSGLLTSVAGVYIPSKDAPYQVGHFIHIENDEDRQRLVFPLEMLLAILRGGPKPNELA